VNLFLYCVNAQDVDSLNKIVPDMDADEIELIKHHYVFNILNGRRMDISTDKYVKATAKLIAFMDKLNIAVKELISIYSLMDLPSHYPTSLRFMDETISVYVRDSMI
jgi:hypothetical protein